MESVHLDCSGLQGKKDKTDLELLEFFLGRLPIYFTSGLCQSLKKLCGEGKIDIKEYMRLLNFIEANDPRATNGRKGYAYYFPIGMLGPRIEFIKQIIKKVKNDTKNS